MSKRITPRSAVGVGLSTLVTIMVAVLLTTFSVLALVSARADLRLSDKATDSAEHYYAADGEAEQWLADMEAFVRNNRGHLEWGDSAALSALADKLSAAGYKATVDNSGNVHLTETFAIDERRDLIVEIALDTVGETDILRWQTTPKR
ncbi:MAG: hypothetical protein LBC23_02415 [Coriobacteriales bacterium]|jgi:hypothetical protein|nr:hypothetical protein [Coriobacteriales bacterium]